MKFRQRSGTTAFTMIEVMVATAILVLIVFAIYSSWTAILRAKRAGLDVAVETQRARIAGQTIEQALLSAQLFAENMQYYAPYFANGEDFSYFTIAARLPKSFPGSGYFGDEVVRRLEFQVVPGKDNKNELVMTQFPIFAYTNETVGPYSLTLMRDVTWFATEFWDAQQGEWVPEFTSTNQLPKLMRVYLGWGHAANDYTEPTDWIERTIALPGAIIMGDVQRPQVGGAPTP